MDGSPAVKRPPPAIPAGLPSQLLERRPDVRQAEQLVYTATSEIADLNRRIGQQENFLSILLGNNPGPITPRGKELTDQPQQKECRCPRPLSIREKLLARPPHLPGHRGDGVPADRAA